jgi:hypothetical protein
VSKDVEVRVSEGQSAKCWDRWLCWCCAKVLRQVSGCAKLFPIM